MLEKRAPFSLRNRLLLRLAAASATLVLAGCDTVGYYRQAVVGQLHLLSQRQAITRVLQNAELPAVTRTQLQLVLELRQFASQHLQLDTGQHYDTYVDLGREFVVWNVFAAPEFSLQLHQWCYPVAGCVSYRGYFAEAAARRQAGQLSAEGWETYVGGVTAYSTLGWFDDPVLSSMLRRDDIQLAGVLFHELAHQRVYAAGDTEFNESFATLVEQEGQQRWLQQQPEQRRIALAASLEQTRTRQQQFVALVQSASAELAALYAEALPDASRRARKAVLLQSLRQRYAELKQQWDGYNGYDRWFDGPLNNAQLGTVTTYNKWVPAFRWLLQQCNGDFVCFFREADALAQMDAATRLQRLQELSLAP